MAYENPVNPLPPAVILLVSAYAAIEATFALGAAGFIGGPQAVGWRLEAIEDFAMSGRVFEQVLFRGDWSLDLVRRFVTYPFIHLSTTHMLFAGALTLAVGKFVTDSMGWAAFLVIFFAGAIGGAIGFALVIGGLVPLVGGHAPLYALIGAYTFLTWLDLRRTGGNQLSAFRIIAFLLTIQLAFAVLIRGNPRWVADVAGFAAGFLVTIPLAPGGWTAMLDRLRAR